MLQTQRIEAKLVSVLSGCKNDCTSGIEKIDIDVVENGNFKTLLISVHIFCLFQFPLQV